jgi:phosphoserine phosphatase
VNSRFRTVIFDCDSTLSGLEGIEELARDHQEEVARLTDLAMTGRVPLEEVYGHRLALIRPSREQVDWVGRRYVEAVVPGASETVRALYADGVTVQILSGGLTPAVRILARHLGIADDRVAAVDVWFDTGGVYAGFDADSLLARSGGKRRWIETHGRDLPRPMLLVGDGATDLEARPAIDAFAAFSGVVTREEIARQADVVLPGPSLTAVLDYCGVRLYSA